MVRFNFLGLSSLLPFAPLLLAPTNAFVTPGTGTFVGRLPKHQEGRLSKQQEGHDVKALPFFDTSLSASDTSTAPEIPDDVLRAMLRDTAADAGITDYDEELHLKMVKDSLDYKNGVSYGGSLTQIYPVDDSGFLSEYPRMTFTANSFSSPLYDASDYECELAMFDFSVEAVALAMGAAGMPSGASKKVAKALVRRARKKLMKEMKGIVKEHFGSPNPFNIASGLFKIMGILIGDLGFNEIVNDIWDSVSWWDAIKIVALLSLYFVSGGAGLAAKLAIMTPDIIDCVEAGYDVTQCC